MTCPRCGAEDGPDDASCARCGLIPEAVAYYTRDDSAEAPEAMA